MITSNAKIFCVDDEPDLLNITEDILRSAGFEVIRATTGYKCLTLARKEHPDLILLDVVLSDINGFDVCKQIKSDRELFGIYVILISGKEISSETQAKVLDAGADGYIVRPVSGRDLLARVQAMIRLKQTETALRKSEGKIRALTESTSDWIWEVDQYGVYTYASPKIKDLLGYEPNEVIGKTPFDFMPENESQRLLKIFHSVAETREPFSKLENINLHKDGRLVILETSGVPIFDKDGNLCGYRGIDRDITERKQAEEMLNKSKKETEEVLHLAEAASRAKSEFLANMSHELTTPLNSIIGFSQILQDRLYGDLNENQKEYVSYILKSGVHLLGLLNDILDISKLETGTGELKKNRFLLKDLLTTMIIYFKEKSLEKNILLGFEIAPEAEIEIEADLAMMKQIIFNLIDNALKYTPKGGSVSVQARLRNSEQDTVNSYKEKKELFTKYYSLTTDRNFVEISVVDTGIGIKQEDIPMLFQTFTQLESPYAKKYAGTGLGLALTKKLVEFHGGRIWAEGEYGKGSRFTFVIPIQKEST